MSLLANLPAPLLVFVGGGTGALCRWLLTVTAGRALGAAFPYGTLAANALGSLLMGVLTALLVGIGSKDAATGENLRLLLGVGVLGGFTTFSSFSMETLKLLQTQGAGTAALNVAANLLLGAVCVGCGWYLGRSL